MPKARVPRLVLSLVMLIVSISGCRTYYGYWYGTIDGKPPSSLQQAKDFAAQGKRDEAITEYRKHLEQRRNDPDRPADENPYFYLLLIGDLQLELGRTQEARVSYLEAREHQVERDLFIDRWRKLARSYSQAGDYERAINTLKEYREDDPAIFDFDIDQLHKEMIGKEDRRVRSPGRPQALPR